jgi:RND superfamily putative drug exporter
VLVVVLAVLASGRWATRLEGGIGSVAGCDAAVVEARLASAFEAPFAHTLVVVVRPAPGGGEAAVAARALRDALAGDPAVRRTWIWPTRPGEPGVLVLGLDAPTLAAAERLVVPMKARIAAWRDTHPGTEVLVTGQAPYNVDLSLRANEESARGEQRVVPLTLAALLWIFGGLAAALTPLVAGLAAVLTAVGALSALATLGPLSAYAASIASMLGLGLAIDYALLIVSRWREEHALGAAPPEALERALAASVPAIALSAVTVAAALAALLWVPVLDTQGLAIGGLLVALLSLAAAVTLTPALAALLGPRLARARWLPGEREAAARLARWEAWARWVVDRPWPVFLAAAGLLLAMAWPVRGLQLAFPEISQMPDQVEAVRGWRVLEGLGDSGALMPVRVLIEAPDPVLARARLEGVLAASAWLRTQPWVQTVRTPVGGGEAWRSAARRLGPVRLQHVLPEPARWYVSRDGRQLLLELVPRPGTTLVTAKAAVRELRQASWARFPGLAGCTVRVGGAAALTLDLEQAAIDAAAPVAATIFALTLVALFWLTRSWLLPVKAVVANVLTVAASLGLTIAICQTPGVAEAVGFTAPLPGVMPGLVLLLCAVVFGLSMDYEIFLLHRVLEGHHAGLDDRAAVAHGLARSAGVITGGALLMVLVFAGFATTDLPVVKVLGLALAIGVLLDATVVRLALVPALMAIAGRYNWVPGPRRPEAASAWLREEPVSSNDGKVT